MANKAENLDYSPMNIEQFKSNYSGIEDMIPIAVSTFLSAYPTMMEKIKAAIENSDASALELSAHSFKGSVSNFHADSAMDLAYQLEQIGKNKDLKDAEKIFADLVKEMEKLQPVLKSLLQG